MGTNPLAFPERDSLAVRPVLDDRPVFIPAAPSSLRRPEPIWRYLILFALTVASTTQAGGLHYAAFIVGFSNVVPSIPLGSLLLHGLWYSVSILAILGCHELGHYYACRY